MKKIQNKKNESLNEGITLIALVVTIVVLLILAGITINMLFSENGIITKARQAAEETKKAEENDIKGMQNVVNEIDKIILNNKGVTNPYDPDGWEYAWTCTEGTWSDKITAGTSISDDVDIVAKFYKTGNKITPCEISWGGQTFTASEGDEYTMVVEGTGTMGPLSDTFGVQVDKCYGWQKEIARAYAGQTIIPIFVYVKEAIICDGIENIGDSTFSVGLSIEKIKFGKDIKIIGKRAINNCKTLKSIVIPETVLEIDKSIFFGDSNLEEAILPNTITIIPSECFCDCSALKTIEIPSSVTKIDYTAFQSCTSLEEITIPSNVVTIGLRAFENCTSLSKVKILSVNEELTIDSDAFYNLADNSVIYVLNEDVKTKLEGKYDSTKTTIQVITQEEMNNI